MRLAKLWISRGASCLMAALTAMTLHTKTSAPAIADVWVLDKNTTTVHFTYDHLGVSRQSGRFKDIEGRLEFSPTDPERGTVDVVLKAFALSTGVAELDRLLRSADFFDTSRHPTIRFRSVGVKPISDREGEVDGELTLMGVTWPVTLNVRWHFTGEHPLSSVNPAYQGRWVSGFTGTTVIERSRWGIKRGIPLISDQVAIRIEAEFVKVDR